MDERSRCLAELRRVRGLVERELRLAEEGKSDKPPSQLRQILKELAAMERARAKSEFMPYYPRGITDSWSLADPLGQELCGLASLYDMAMRG